MKHLFTRCILPALGVLVMATSVLWAGTTGKIAGTITDKSTKEPLVGAVVTVGGTQLGTVTDFNGHYTILNVSPELHTVQVSILGYRRVVVDDVRVSIDQTTQLSLALEPQSVEMGEMVVVAERNMLKPDVATSVVAVSNKEITALPVNDLQGVMSLQAGIKDGQIRGSGQDQALFMLDGTTMRDPRNNQAMTKVAMSTVKEVSVERGGFTAEYGQVQSGIINVVTNEGKPKGYSGSVNFRISPPSPRYYRGNGIPDVYSPNSYWMRSFMDPAVCWTGTTTPVSQGGWDQYTQTKYPQFVGWNQISEALLTDNNPNNDLTPLGAQRAFEYETRKGQRNDIADYDIDAGFGGPVPFISEYLGNLRFFASYRGSRFALLFPFTRPDYTDYDARVMVNADITSGMKLRVAALSGEVNTMEDNWNKGNYLQWPYQLVTTDVSATMFSDNAYSLADIGHQSISAKLTHTLNTSTYYEVSIDHYRSKYHSYAPASRDTSIKTEIVPGFFESPNPFGYFPSQSDGIYIKTSDQLSLARDNSVSSATTIKADISSQINFSNLAKAGIEFVYNDLNLDYGYIQFLQSDPTFYNSRVQMHNFPIRAAAYIQDKFESKGLTVNIGVRADYSDPRSNWWSVSPYDPTFISYKYSNSAVFAMTEAKGQLQISPRLGISHPITENSKLYFNYGHYKQMPQYEMAFRVDRRPDHSLVNIGDPNLTLAKTISYELGYDHQLFDNMFLLQLTAFYRDISDQQNRTQYFPQGGQSYYLTTSTGYQDTRGIEITLRKSAGSWLSGFINYTYQASSNGHFGQSELYEDPEKQVNQYDNKTNKYYQTRSLPAPYARANINITSPADFGPQVLGNNVLGDIMFSIVSSWSAGGWTTYNPKNAPGVDNNVQYVDWFDASMRITKSVDFKAVKLQLFADISNLFNGLHLNNRDDVGYRQSLHLPKSDAYDNIPGDDKFGDYRNPGVEWQPVENNFDRMSVGNTRAYYYEAKTGKYWQYVENGNPAVDQRWVEVDQSKIDQMNKDKSYINMPSPSTYWFLNPRNITYGIRIAFDLD
ncbi:MAG TPA: TonB-dependent receptor [Bacteroidota bacterium]|nr:TonB-dependent receptor [Bacteroidota bacterium]